MKKVIIVSVVVLLMLMEVTGIQPTVRTGSVVGAVELVDGSKIPGVVVTLTGKNLGKRTTVTSEQGAYRFLHLTPGVYSLRFELEGFKTLRIKDFSLKADQVFKPKAIMETAALQECVGGFRSCPDNRFTEHNGRSQWL